MHEHVERRTQSNTHITVDIYVQIRRNPTFVSLTTVENSGQAGSSSKVSTGWNVTVTNCESRTYTTLFGNQTSGHTRAFDEHVTSF